jgi:hypothetical protein
MTDSGSPGWAQDGVALVAAVAAAAVAAAAAAAADDAIVDGFRAMDGWGWMTRNPNAAQCARTHAWACAGYVYAYKIQQQSCKQSSYTTTTIAIIAIITPINFPYHIIRERGRQNTADTTTVMTIKPSTSQQRRRRWQ